MPPQRSRPNRRRRRSRKLSLFLHPSRVIPSAGRWVALLRVPRTQQAHAAALSRSERLERPQGCTDEKAAIDKLHALFAAGALDPARACAELIFCISNRSI